MIKIPKNIIVLFFVILIFASPVYSQGVVNETYEVYAAITQSGIFYNADSANVSIYYPNSTIFISNQPMTNFGIGRFIYNFTPEVVGNWFATATFYNTTGGIVGQSSEDIYISTLSDALTEEQLNMTFEIWIIFFIGLALLVVAKYIDNIIFIFTSGVWFLGAGAAGITFLNSTIPEVTFFFIIGLATIYHGISEYVHNVNDKKRAKFADDS